jgi:hypothetical protein
MQMKTTPDWVLGILEKKCIQKKAKAIAHPVEPKKVNSK